MFEEIYNNIEEISNQLNIFFKRVNYDWVEYHPYYSIEFYNAKPFKITFQSMFIDLDLRHVIANLVSIDMNGTIDYYNKIDNTSIDNYINLVLRDYKIRNVLS